MFPLLAAAAAIPPANAAEPDPVAAARIYRTPAERREAGLGRQLTDWLTVSGLAELEYDYRNSRFRAGHPATHRDHDSFSVQLGFNIEFTAQVRAELVFEADTDGNDGRLDEGLLELEADDWGFKAGRLYVPFGEYYSNFVNGPMLEFGETRASAVVADYALTDRIDVFAFLFDGEAGKRGRRRVGLDWGLGLELVNRDESFKAGLGYLSDLAETDESLLADAGGIYQQRVGAWTAYVLYGAEHFAVTGEVVYATRAFHELDASINRPLAYNLELAYFPHSALQLALRLEGSDELADQPKRQYGVSATWRLSPHASVAADYLYGRFKRGFVVDDDGIETRSQHIATVQLSLEF